VTCRIEPVSAGACLALARLHRACFPADPWNAAAIRTILQLPGTCGRVAWDGADLAGFLLARDLGEECEILSLGVLPEQRRNGIGRALLQANAEEARRSGLVSAVLEVAADNKAAQNLYFQTGFVEVGRRPNYYRRGPTRIDALILRASLSARPYST